MTSIFFLILVGFLLLYLGGEVLVRGSAALALRLHLSPLVIGLTIVAYGTGMPELVVSVQASLLSKADLAVGNILGSNIVNCGFVLGLVAVLSPLPVGRRILKYDIPLLFFLSLACMAVLYFTGIFTREIGLVFIILLLIYTFWTLKSGKVEKVKIPESIQKIPVSIAFIVGGLFFLVIGGRFFLEGAVKLATLMGVSEAVIGLTVVAIGTSLPELATCLVAVYKGHTELLIGNIIGSSIFNILAILGVSAFIHPLHTTDLSYVDGAWMAVFVAAVYLLAFVGKKLGRLEGVLLLLGYIFCMMQLS